MSKTYISGTAMREARPRSKRLLGIGPANHSTVSIREVGEKYTLQPATANTLGGIKVGAGIHVDPDGTISNDAKSSLRIRIVRIGTAWSLDESEMTGQQMAEALGSDVYQGVILVADSGNASPQYPAEVEYTGVGHVVVSVNTHELVNSGIAQKRYVIELDMQHAAVVMVTSASSRIEAIVVPIKDTDGELSIEGGQTAAKAIYEAFRTNPNSVIFFKYVDSIFNPITPCYYVDDTSVSIRMTARYSSVDSNLDSQKITVSISANGTCSFTLDKYLPVAGTTIKGVVSVGRGILLTNGQISVPHTYVRFDVDSYKTEPQMSYSNFAFAAANPLSRPFVYVQKNGKQLPAILEETPSSVIITATELTPDGSGGLAWTHHKVVWNENAMTYTSENGTI